MAIPIPPVFDRANWFMRRRYLYAVTMFVMLLMVMSATGLIAEAIALAIINNGFWVLATFTGTYVFGAVWDHANQRKFGTVNEPGTTTVSTSVTTERLPDAVDPA